MNERELLEARLNGDKIRQVSWHNQCWIQLDDHWVLN